MAGVSAAAGVTGAIVGSTGGVVGAAAGSTGGVTGGAVGATAGVGVASCVGVGAAEGVGRFESASEAGTNMPAIAMNAVARMTSLRRVVRGNGR